MSLVSDALRKARQEAAEKERRAQGLDLPHIAPPPARTPSRRWGRISTLVLAVFSYTKSMGA